MQSDKELLYFKYCLLCTLNYYKLHIYKALRELPTIDSELWQTVYLRQVISWIGFIAYELYAQVFFYVAKFAPVSQWLMRRGAFQSSSNMFNFTMLLSYLQNLL